MSNFRLAVGILMIVMLATCVVVPAGKVDNNQYVPDRAQESSKDIDCF